MRNIGVQCVLVCGLGCALLHAQQQGRPDVASNTKTPHTGVAVSAMSWTQQSLQLPQDVVQSRTVKPVFAASISPGLPQTPSMYQNLYLQSSIAVCTQPQDPIASAIQQNAFEHLDFHPAAIMSAFTHENMVKMAHNFRPGTALPDAPSYVPLTSRQKFDRFLHSTHSGDTLVGTVIDSAYAEATGAYPKFGGGMEGYGKRYGATLAGAEAGLFFGKFLYPTLLHQDPRYFPSHENDISDRIAYAASRVLITRSDDGRNVFNSSMILSQLTQAALSNGYVPYRTATLPGVLEDAAASLGSVAQAYILKEFWPDIKQFLTKHQPGPVRRFSQRFDFPPSQVAGSK